jgi:hypothetical protein
MPNSGVEAQAAMILDQLNDVVTELLDAGTPLPIVTMSLFYSWLSVESKMVKLNKHKIMHGEGNLEEMFRVIATKVKAILVELPDLEPITQQSMAEVNKLKAMVPGMQDAAFASHNMLSSQARKVNARIYKCCNKLLMSFSTVILANLLFSLWVRLSIIVNCIPASVYHKIEYYFDDVVNEVRKYLPRLF